MKRFLTINFSADMGDANLSQRVVKILRQHADDIENHDHVAGKAIEGSYIETIDGTKIKIDWKARYEE